MGLNVFNSNRNHICFVVCELWPPPGILLTMILFSYKLKPADYEYTICFLMEAFSSLSYTYIIISTELASHKVFNYSTHLHSGWVTFNYLANFHMQCCICQCPCKRLEIVIGFQISFLIGKEPKSTDKCNNWSLIYLTLDNINLYKWQSGYGWNIYCCWFWLEQWYINASNRFKILNWVMAYDYITELSVWVLSPYLLIL